MNERRFLLLIFSIALIIRLVAVFIYSDYLTPAKDALFYDKTAISILEGHGIVNLKGNPASLVPPLYPIFLSIIYYIFSHSYIAVRVIQSVISSLLCVFLYYIGKNIFGKDEGKLASSISVIFPSFVIFSYYGGPGFLITENLFILILTGIILYISKIEDLNYINCIVIGILTGLLILTRFVAICLPFIILIYLVTVFRGHGKRIFKFLSIFLIFIFLTMSPWTLRNWLISHKVSVLLPDEMASSLSAFIKTFPELEVKWNITYKELQKAIHWGEGDAYLSKKWNINEKNINSVIRKKIFHEISRNASRYIKSNFLIKNMKIFWSPYYNPLVNSNTMKFNFTYAFLMPFFLWGIFFAFLKDNRKAIFPLSLIIGLNLIHLFTTSGERYRLPIEPIMLVFAAFGFFSLRRIFSKPKQGLVFLSSVVLFFIMNVIAYLNSDFTVKLISNIIP